MRRALRMQHRRDGRMPGRVARRAGRTPPESRALPRICGRTSGARNATRTSPGKHAGAPRIDSCSCHGDSCRHIILLLLLYYIIIMIIILYYNYYYIVLLLQLRNIYTKSGRLFWFLHG